MTVPRPWTGLTVTVTVLASLPPELAQVSVKLVVAVRPEITAVSLGLAAPLQPPDFVQLVGLLELAQPRVVLPPVDTALGLAASDTTGA